MNEEFNGGNQSSQNDGWTRGASAGTNATQNTGWSGSASNEMGAAQENADGFYTSQGMAQGASMNANGNQSGFGSQDAFAANPVNMVTGIVGAFLGVLIGVVLWVVIYQMGYIAGIAGAVMMVCAFKGFELLGRGINIVGSVICVVMVLAAVYFAHNIAIALSVMQEIEGYSFGAAYRDIPVFRKYSEFNSAYLHDLIIGYVITLVAIVPAIKSAIFGKR